MIDPATVQIVVMAYREEPNRHLQAWLNALRERGYAWRYGPETHPVYVARNQVVNRFLAEDTGKEHLVMVDSALVPISAQAAQLDQGASCGDGPASGRAGETVRVLTEPGDVVYCGYFGRYGTAGHYLNFGCGCFRASRPVYEAMSPPWFDFGYDATLTRKTMCECVCFANRLSALSLAPACQGEAKRSPVVPLQVGIVGRLTELVLTPTGHGRMRIVSPHELPVG